MSAKAYHILRVGLGITFAWIGVFILRSPETWGGYLQPWARNLLPFPLKTVMLSTGWFDVAIGALLLLGIWPRLVAFGAAAHLIIVLLTSGINDITVRDIGLLAAALALVVGVRQKR